MADVSEMAELKLYVANNTYYLTPEDEPDEEL